MKFSKVTWLEKKLVMIKFNIFCSTLACVAGFVFCPSEDAADRKSCPLHKLLARVSETCKLIRTTYRLASDQKQKFFRHFAQYDTTIQVGKKKFGGYRHFNGPNVLPVLSI